MDICLTLEVLLEPFVLRFSPLLEFLLNMSQELRGDTWDRSEDGASCRTTNSHFMSRTVSSIMPEVTTFLQEPSITSSAD